MVHITDPNFNQSINPKNISESSRRIRLRQLNDIAHASPLGQLLRLIGLRAGHLVNFRINKRNVRFLTRARALEPKINDLERQLGKKITRFPPPPPKLIDPVTKEVIEKTDIIDSIVSNENISTTEAEDQLDTQLLTQSNETFQILGAPDQVQAFSQNTLRIESLDFKLLNNKLTGTVNYTFIDVSQFGDQFSELALHVDITPIGGVLNPLIIPIFVDRFTRLGFLANVNRTVNTKL